MALAILKISRFLKPTKLYAAVETSPLVIDVFNKRYAAQSTEEHLKFLKKVEGWDKSIKKEKTSRAMKAYLQRSKEYDAFMKKQEIAYEIGKRHLANMMGEDPATFTQEDVDAAIEYLFPSGIYERSARPMMKPPHLIYPEKKAAEFDDTGRPYHFLFYTAKPNLYQALFDTTGYMNDLKNNQTSILARKALVDLNTKCDITGYVWLNKEELEKIFLEGISEKEYDGFITCIKRLIDLPYSNKYDSFVKTYLKPVVSQKQALDIPVPKYDENGRAYVTTFECTKKTARGHVTVRSPGTGIFTINGKDITYFESTQAREAVS